ncbi:nuclear transport factor 2 family protein [Pseudonocardia parietis]|uniref:3-phenylpropionate/cinnamic acid dioxygenase small subunit n=1 Tax=Pseudonocardia parietis TaxID=570936 RepID=A0ABS4VUX1_9PSEU|nr:nuclear transport factor 2 family protein [Pseudonocardia parietis]MBP2367732.1 3-phenylpropionate/cinnamic acid dioxygenase small subunit [Pseudonocardia parietis]
MARTPQDTLEIHELVVRYGFVVDDREWDGFGDILTEDAVIDLRDHDVDPPVGLGPYTGLDEITHHYRDVLTHPSQHMLVNHVIDDISDDEVVVRSKALVLLPEQRTAGLVYRDVVVRTPKGWRIRQKNVKLYR